jgi:hypothetical protein
MGRINRFFLDEAATAEATSTVVMIAAAGILLATAFGAWYTGITDFFTNAGSTLGAKGNDVAGAIGTAP